MGDFAPIPLLAGGVQPYRMNPDPQAARLAPVAASADSRGAHARMDTGSQTHRPDRPSAPAEGEQDAGDKARREIDEFTIAGPTPAFHANVLEIERELQRTIERLEEARSRTEAQTAIKVADQGAGAPDASVSRDAAEDAEPRYADAEALSVPAKVPAAALPDKGTGGDAS